MSTNGRIYLDFNATAPLHPAARAAVIAALDALRGNPSSIHGEGRAARDVVERARMQVAALAERPREQLVFTSGGTEANALGVAALAASVVEAGGPRVASIAAIEHPSLLAAVRGLAGWRIVEAPLAPVIEPGIGLVAAGVVNHELGARIDADMVARAHAVGARVHLDAVQAAGRLALGPFAAADALALSGHKLGGPPGAGAVFVTVDPPPTGGHQERGRRGGTENVLGIAGFGAAAAAVDREATAATRALGEQFEAALVAAVPEVRIHGAELPRAGGTINAGFTGARGESLVIALDLAGVAASTGAACTSGSVQPSPVLLALGLPAERAREAVRFSLGPTTTRDEIDRVIAILPGIVARARGRRTAP